MYVPNYVPEPIEISDNVTLRPYSQRVTFLRRVLALHFATLGILAGLAALHGPNISLPTAGVQVVVYLLVLSILRIRTRGTRYDALFSNALFPFLLIGLSFVIRDWVEAGLPLWALLIGAFCALMYALLCGRDYSFVGQWFLSMIVSSVVIAGIINAVGFDAVRATQALALNMGYLTYVVYDSASLLARRRIGEELTAVVDLYRDVLNFGGYTVRCLRHWKKHRIWTAR